MPATIRLKLARATLRAIAADAAGREVTTTTRRVFNRARVLSPVDTGNLRASHRMEINERRGRKVIGRVLTNVRYAAPVHEGTRAYVIRPKRARSRRNPNYPAALRFKVNGRFVYAQMVRMPPRPGKPWLRTALYEVAVKRGYTVKPN